ncbi:winged helix-turn-helix domain-containing protein [Actinomadura sp. KC216]|uniref:AfsR/SARP family transcriptional regulator n=1 Tax=Actinomadura sp. KC216 TaxID=2530370 RepID=UPI001FB831EE|nr:winged helix-turn-helix domain-containing protein [Actinomadura sp. KC216]
MALGGGRQRALLVRLLLGADRVVPVDRLVDELWGDRPPASARTQVHTLVHRVRRGRS